MRRFGFLPQFDAGQRCPTGGRIAGLRVGEKYGIAAATENADGPFTPELDD